MKKLKNLYQEICSFENLLEAYKQARKCKRYRSEVLEFTANLEENLITIQNELTWKTYEVGRYKEFFVYDPKKRLIMALPFRDRVVQWAIYRVLNPLLDRRYISHSYACRIGMGTHKVISKVQYWLRKLYRGSGRTYALKMDVSKYFYRVDHGVLVGILERIIADRDLLEMLETIIRSETTDFGLNLGDHGFTGGKVAGVGMPIGNLTSQMFANLYLNELDQYCKHALKTQYYARYMDDVLVLHPDKRYLRTIKERVEQFLAEHLKLQLNNKTCIRSLEQGVEFCGYRIWPTHVKLRKKSALKMKHRLVGLRKRYARGDIGFAKANASVQSYMGIMKHFSSYSLRKSIFGNFVLKRSEQGG